MLSRKSCKQLTRQLAFLLALSCVSLPSIAAVIKNENSQLSQSTGVPLYEWQDDSNSDPKDILVGVHGFAQDAGALSTIAKSLAGQGYLVVTPDLRGHGRWQDNGTTMEENLAQSCTDLAHIISMLHKKHKKANIYCLGESTGSGVVLSAIAKESEGVKGIILCAAGSQPAFHNPAAMGSSFIKGMATFVTQVPIKNYLQHYLSDDSRVADEMINDPLAKKSQSAMQLLGTMSFIRDMPERAAKLPASIPVLVLQGSADQIVNPESANSVFEAIKSHDKEFVPIVGSGHILVGTSYIKPQVLNTIDAWLAKHGGS